MSAPAVIYKSTNVDQTYDVNRIVRVSQATRPKITTRVTADKRVSFATGVLFADSAVRRLTQEGYEAISPTQGVIVAWKVA